MTTYFISNSNIESNQPKTPYSNENFTKMSDYSEPYDDDIPASSDESHDANSIGYTSSNEED